MMHQLRKKVLAMLQRPLQLYLLLSCLFLICIFFANRNTQVATFLADNQHTGDFSKYNSANQIIRWGKYTTYGYFISSPVISNDVIYVGETHGNALRAIDVARGDLLWSFIAEGEIPFSPAVTGNTVYVTSGDGRLYALNKNNGTKKWEFRVPDFYSIASSPIVSNDTAYFGSRDGYLYAINSNTGKMRWRFKTGGGIDTSPIITGNTLFFGSFDGYFYAVNTLTGKERWKYQTGDKIIGSPAEQDGIVFFGSRDSFVYALQTKTGKLLWKVKTNGPIETPPTITDNSIVIVNTNNTLYSLNIKTGKQIWEKPFKSEAYTAASYKDATLYIGSSDNHLYALRKNDGKELWKYHSDGSIASATSLIKNIVLFTNRSGSLYILDRQSGVPYITNEFSASSNTPSVGKYEIYELTVKHPSNSYQYPWLDASISATFKHEDKSVSVNGFYYDKNLWKIRFSPDEIGDWNWKIHLSIFGNIVKTIDGRFKATPSEKSGFIRNNIYNKASLSLDNGALFHPLGLQTCIGRYDDMGIPFYGTFIDTKPVDIDTYLKTYGSNGSGFNIYRWGADNCSFHLWNFSQDERIQKTFLIREGVWGDKLMKNLKENKFHIWMSLFSWSAPFAQDNNIPQMLKDVQIINPYLDYIVARYAAYVDVWEIGNEIHATREWITYISDYIRSIDPYNHLITTSWERPEMKEIQINAPHYYQSDTLESADTAFAKLVSMQNNWGKPLIFGELGNQGANWDVDSAIRMRVHIWVGFFLNTGMIFWDASNTKEYKNNENANIYIGPEERLAVHTFEKFIQGISPDVHTLDMHSFTRGVRSYALRTPEQIIGYLYQGNSQTTRATAQILVPVQFSHPHIIWIDPAKGTIIREGDMNTDIQTSPEFTIDIAYKISESNTK
jgi:outer membrane protein assembly factor BamB